MPTIPSLFMTRARARTGLCSFVTICAVTYVHREMPRIVAPYIEHVLLA